MSDPYNHVGRLVTQPLLMPLVHTLEDLADEVDARGKAMNHETPKMKLKIAAELIREAHRCSR